MAKKKRRAFTPEFKADAVKLCRVGDRTIGQVARDLGLTDTALREWVRELPNRRLKPTTAVGRRGARGSRWRLRLKRNTLGGQRMPRDWFRNQDWDAAISEEFEKRLCRARRKGQYLRIQASTLASTRPIVALELLERYFAMSNDFDHAQAHVDRATALKTLNRFEEAADAYEAALQREAVFPNLQTQAYLELPLLIATRALESRFDRALAILEAGRGRLVVPVDHFRWHAARALILSAKGERSHAAPDAHLALAAASRNDSGFRYHPAVGLVTSAYGELLKDLATFGAA